jgi:NADH dehydrogenase
MTVNRERVVIVGAGFAGIQAAKTLAKSGAEIVIVDRNNYHTFIPLLYQVATGFISAETIAYPIRNWVRRIPHARFWFAEVEALDFETNQVLTSRGSLAYDYLVLSTGSQTRFLGTPGAPKHTFTLRTLADAIALRHQILQCLERAVQTQDDTYVSFIIVGGGPTGVELAGAIRELLDGPFRKDYPTLNLSKARVVLIQSGDTLLKGLPESLGRYALRQLQRRGVEVRLQSRVKAVDEEGVELLDGTVMAGATVIWTAGVLADKPEVSQPSDWNAVSTIGRQEKIVVDSTLQLSNYPTVYAAGDIAHVEYEDDVLIGVAPEALQQGRWAAKNIHRQLKGRSPKPFQYFDKGRAAIIARHAGVVYLFSRIQVTGIVAWFIWLGIHVYYLPGMGNRMAVLGSWLKDYVLGDRPYRQIIKRHDLASSTKR